MRKKRKSVSGEEGQIGGGEGTYAGGTACADLVRDEAVHGARVVHEDGGLDHVDRRGADRDRGRREALVEVTSTAERVVHDLASLEQRARISAFARTERD